MTIRYTVCTRIFALLVTAAGVSSCYQPAHYAQVRYGNAAYANPAPVSPRYYTPAPVPPQQQRTPQDDYLYAPVAMKDLSPLHTHTTVATPNKDMSVVVRPGDTVYAIARAYGASPQAMIRANGLRAPYAISPGQTLVIPKNAYYTVERGDTLSSIARGHRMTAAKLASINNIALNSLLIPGQTLRVSPNTYAPVAKKAPVIKKRRSYATYRPNVVPIPVLKPYGYAQTNTNGSSYTAPVYTNNAPQTGGLLGAVKRMIKREPAGYNQGAAISPQVIRKPYTGVNSAPASIVAAPAAITAVANNTAKPVVVRTSTDNTFMLPVKGAVVANYGPRAGGLFNEGVNISAPSGTPVRAALDGTVVYSGNAIRGYGNLVLVQHAGGYITTYAHNERNVVTKGDTVHKGQVIGYVGNTGQVTGPQLHFGIRKGRETIDPSTLLSEL